MKKLFMKRGIESIVFIFFITLFAASFVQADVDLCPENPYRPSVNHTDPDFVTTGSIFQSWLDVRMLNRGTSIAYDVKATISCFPAFYNKIPVEVSFGDIPAGGGAWSKDYFMLELDLSRYTGNPMQGICWDVTYKDEAGAQHTLAYVAKFCDENCSDICEFTAILLDSFTADAGNQEVTVNWVTGDETNNFGFNVYRSESKDGDYVKINDSIIFSQADSGTGSAYVFVDDNVKNRKTYYYKLEDVDTTGVKTMHGPVSAIPRLIYGIGK